MNALLTIALLVIIAALLVIARQLNRMGRRLSNIEQKVDRSDASSVHDTVHAAFSVGQLRRARFRFETEHRRQLTLETQLYGSADWQGRKEQAGSLSPSLRDSLRTICEAVVQSECAWKEYVFMVEGNLSVANGRESRAGIVQQFRDVLGQTRGTPVVMTVAPNATKVKRVDAMLENWVARLDGVKVEALPVDLPDLAEETFDFGTAETHRYSALLGG